MSLKFQNKNMQASSSRAQGAFGFYQYSPPQIYGSTNIAFMYYRLRL